jgi:hypothetical protein
MLFFNFCQDLIEWAIQDLGLELDDALHPKKPIFNIQ